MSNNTDTATLSYKQAIAALNAAADEKYNAFNSKIVNSEYPTIGVRVPIVRKLARSVPTECRDVILRDFFADPNKTFESVLFAGLLSVRKDDYAKVAARLKAIVPLFGSWAHVDCVIPDLQWAGKKPLDDFKYLLDESGQYSVRSYIILLFDWLTPEAIDYVLETLKGVRYGEYYVDMAAAWLLSECLVKFYDKTVPLFIEPVFPKFVHNKAIQKARESYRITPERKEYLKTLKITGTDIG